jgi:hypothetical protein
LIPGPPRFHPGFFDAAGKLLLIGAGNAHEQRGEADYCQYGSGFHVYMFFGFVFGNGMV